MNDEFEIIQTRKKIELSRVQIRKQTVGPSRRACISEAPLEASDATKTFSKNVRYFFTYIIAWRDRSHIGVYSSQFLLPGPTQSFKSTFFTFSRFVQPSTIEKCQESGSYYKT